jgi:hypothetical protein
MTVVRGGGIYHCEEKYRCVLVCTIFPFEVGMAVGKPFVYGSFNNRR